MDVYYLKKLRKEADKYYHMRLNTEGKYDIFFHNYKVVKLYTANTRDKGFEILKKFKRDHILKRLKELKN